MFHIYTDDEHARVSPACTKLSSSPPQRTLKSGKFEGETYGAVGVMQKQKSKLTVSGHPSEGIITLTHELPFDSFKSLKQAVEELLRMLPDPVVSLSSLQHLNADGEIVELSASTFVRQDFVVQDTSSSRIYLRARVCPGAQPPLPERQKATATETVVDARPERLRRALGCRDPNVVARASNPTTRTSKNQNGKKAGKGCSSSTTRDITTTTKHNSNSNPLTVPVRNKATSVGREGRKASAKKNLSSSRSRAPKFIFGERTKKETTPQQDVMTCVTGTLTTCTTLAGQSSGDATSTAALRRSRAAGGSAKESVITSREAPARRRRKDKVAAPACRKPSWNDRNEPEWEEAEKKKAIMRSAARARILGRRAAAASKRTLHRAVGGAGSVGGHHRRVFRRARRDCRVTDARRQKLGAYIFHDPIGTPPSPLGKRTLGVFKDLGRQAAIAMKYLNIPLEEAAPKRARGGSREISVVIHRVNCGTVGGDGGNSPPEVAPPSDNNNNNNNNNNNKRTAAVSARKKCPTDISSTSSSSSSAIAAALRPLTTRPGDIGFRGASASGGAIMRPPTSSSSLAVARRARATNATMPSAATTSAAAVAAGVTTSVTMGVTALTAAAAAKVVSAADAPVWSGRLRARSSAGTTSAAAPAAVMSAVGGRGRGVGGTRRRGVGGTENRVGRRAAAAQSARDAAAAAAIMAKLAKGGASGKGRGGSSEGGGGGRRKGSGDVESLQEQVAVLKAASGLSDEELTWRMETSKPEANAYRIASAALDRAETTYEKLLWRQGQLEIARARFSGRGRGGDDATSSFASAMARVVKTNNDRSMSVLKSTSEAVLTTLKPIHRDSGGAATAKAATSTTISMAIDNHSSTVSGGACHVRGRGTAAAAAAASATLFPADAAAAEVRTAAERMAQLATAVEATARTGSAVDRAAVAREVGDEAAGLAACAAGVERELRALEARVEAAVGQVEVWQRRRADAPEFSAEEAAREEVWNETNREINLAALREMRALLPEAVWDMNAGDIQAAAAVGVEVQADEKEQKERYNDDCGDGVVKGVGGNKEKEEAEKDNKGSGGRVGGVFYPSDLCVRIRECRPLHWLVTAPEDIVGSNFLTGEGAAAFTQLEGMDVVEMRAVWCVLPKEFARDGDGKKAEWRARFRAQLEGLARQESRAIISAGYPSAEATRTRAQRLREQHQRLESRKARLSALTGELAEAKLEVDSACADARSDALRARYGAKMLRAAREAAKEAYSVLLRERKALVASMAEGQRTLSATYPSLSQLESEAESIAQIFSDNSNNNNNNNNNNSCIEEGGVSANANATAASSSVAGGVRVPGAFTAEPELRRRASAVAKKLTPEQERLLREREVRRAVSSREAGDGRGGGGGRGRICNGVGGENMADIGADGIGGSSADIAGDGNFVISSRDNKQSLEGFFPDKQQNGSEMKGGGIGTGSGAVILTGGGGFRKNNENTAHDTGSGSAGGGRLVDGGKEQEGNNEPYRADTWKTSRRRVKAAPEVLAFLTKEYSARAAAAATTTESAEMAIPVAVTVAEGEDRDSAVRQPPTDDSAPAHGGSSIIPSLVACAPGGDKSGGANALSQLPLPPPPPPSHPTSAVPKPMSKSLAALLERTGGSGSAGHAIKVKATPQSLGFLEELKARSVVAKGKSIDDTGAVSSLNSTAGVPMTAGGKGGGIGIVGGQGGRGGLSFPDELKARTATSS